jgi:hypothetical protein
MQLRRAYCLVAGGDCLGRDGPRPCVVRSRTRSREVRVSIVLARLRDGREVVREERSDGTVRVTVVQGSGASVGRQLRLGRRVAGRDLGVDVGAEGGGDVGLERTFEVADGGAADRLIARLDDEDVPAGGALAGVARFLLHPAGRGGEEAARTVTVGTRAQAEAALDALGIDLGAAGLGGLTMGAAGLGGVTMGARVDGRTGRPTLLLRFSDEASAALTAPLAHLERGVATRTDVELTLGGDRRPVALLVRQGTELHDGAEGELQESELRLDLADPEARSLAGRLVHGDLAAARALGARLAAQARIDVRRYATTRDATETGVSLKVLGGSVSTVTGTARLVSAKGREPGLGWSQNLECLLSAGIAA